jgi:hypothetical protein
MGYHGVQNLILGYVYGLHKGSNILKIFGMKKETNGKPLSVLHNNTLWVFLSIKKQLLYVSIIIVTT